MTRAYPAMALLFALSACGGETEEAANERKTAAGEVLGGSISDAMLPLDTVQSQSPPLRETPRAEPGATKAEAQAQGDAPAASPTPVATPLPAASAATPPEE